MTIDSNTLISNQSNDDGGGLRFLMAGNFPFLVKNNIIANNLSTHEGGGIALDDAPNVTIVNNTIVKNITTATAATNGALGGLGIKPQNPAGLSTGGNSPQLQHTLTAPNSPNWSKPKLLNNIFADNRAGWAVLPNTNTTFNESVIHGIGDPADTAPEGIQRWDVGVADASGLCDSANSTTLACPVGTEGVINFGGISNTTNAQNAGALAHPGAGFSYIGTQNIDPVAVGDGTKAAGLGGIGFVNPQDFLVDSLMWRNNTNVSFPVIVAHMVPVNLLADYHLLSPVSTGNNRSLNAGSLSGAGANAPTLDIDGDTRPDTVTNLPDRGADELTTRADFAINKTASPSTVTAGGPITYTIIVTNNGPAAGNARVSDTLPTGFTGTWSCSATGGATCGAGAIPAGNLSRDVLVTVGGTVTLTFTGTVPANAAVGPLANTASVAPAPGSGVTDNNTANNSSTATVTVQVSGDLAIVITPNPLATVVRGQILPYVVTVTNPGPTTMSGLVTSSSSGSIQGLTLYSCSASSLSSCNGGGGAGALNRTVTVAPGGNVTFTYATTTLLGFPVGVGVTTNAAFGSTITASASLGPVVGYLDTNAGNNNSSVTSTVVARSNLVLTNTTTAANPQGNGNYTYVVTVTNSGSNLDQIVGIALSNPLPLPAGVNFTGLSCTTTGGANSSCGTGGTTGPLSRTINVAANGSVRFTITASRVTAPLASVPHGVVNSTATAVIPANATQTGTLTATRAVTFS